MSLGIDLGRSGAKISAALRQAQHANQSPDWIVLGVPSEAGSRVRDQVARQVGEAAPGARIFV